MDLQQGIQIFELRIYAAEMGHRICRYAIRIHQLILAGFHAHGIDMPFPALPVRLEASTVNKQENARRLRAKVVRRGSL